MSEEQGTLPVDPIHSAIARAIDLRIPNAKVCKVCGASAVELMPEVVNLPVATRPANTFIHHQPCAETVCSNCGHSQLFNLFVLGVLDKNGNFNVPSR